MATAASARSAGATPLSASVSCNRSGPFWVVFQSWMLSEVGRLHAPQANARAMPPAQLSLVGE